MYVSHIENPDNERLVSALSDTQSDTTFILEHTCRPLGVTDAITNMLLSIMFAKNQWVDSQKIPGIFVQRFDTNEKIPQHASSTHYIIPANLSHIATPKIAKQFHFPKTIASELLPLQDCETWLFIAYNSAKALTPRNAIEHDGP